MAKQKVKITKRKYRTRKTGGNSGYRNSNMIMELRELMEDAPDERTRMEFDKFIRKMESM